jgi:tRNA/tmRNA/rRNA uracil-C5-methylase (TrmA/RlmC/RlmD family)
MNESETFIYDDNEFEIRTEVIDGRHCVKIFLNDKIVSPTYSVDFEIHADYFVQYQKSLIDNLKATAKSDITNGMYFNE